MLYLSERGTPFVLLSTPLPTPLPIVDTGHKLSFNYTIRVRKRPSSLSQKPRGINRQKLTTFQTLLTEDTTRKLLWRPARFYAIQYAFMYRLLSVARCSQLF